MKFQTDFDATDFDTQEALEYRPGQKVEIKARPGVFDWIASYDPDMVPPIALVNDPKPRYPHELRVWKPATLHLKLPRFSLPQPFAASGLDNQYTLAPSRHRK